MSLIKQIREDYDVISTEAFTNPLGNIGFKVKNAFQRIVNHFNDITNQRQADSAVVTKLDVCKKFSDNETKIRTIGYIPFKDIKAPVPVGFKGNLRKLGDELTKQLIIFDDLKEKTISPTHSLILRYLGSPQLLSSITNDDFKSIKMFTDEINASKTTLNTMFDFKYNYQTQKISTLFANMNDLLEFNTKLRKNYYSVFAQVQNNRVGLVALAKELSKSIDLLLLRMEQKPEQYAINAINAEKISGLILAVAEAIEYSATLQVYMEQLISTGLDTIQIFVTYIDGADAGFQEFKK